MTKQIFQDAFFIIMRDFDLIMANQDNRMSIHDTLSAGKLGGVFFHEPFTKKYLYEFEYTNRSI